MDKNPPLPASQLNSALAQLVGQAEQVVRRTYGAGECLFSQNEPASWLFYIRTGHVRVFMLSDDGRERTLRILGPADLAGEDAFYLQTKYSGYAEAFEGPVDVVKISWPGYRALIQHWPGLLEELLLSLARTTRELTQTIEMQTFQDLRGRVQTALLAAAGRYGRVEAQGVVIAVHLTHETIASMVGATRSRVSVCLSSLQHEGFYRVVNQQMVLSPWAAGLVLAP